MSFSLNSDQEKAVTHTGSPLLIVAGPGSGKTRVIVERIIHLIRNGIKPSEILCLTFSNKAAEEMKGRLEKIIDISDMSISTIHSFASDLLLDNVLVSGIGLSNGIMSRESQLIWGLKNIDTFDLEYIEIGNNAVEVIKSIVDGISTFKNELITWQELDKYLKGKSLKNLDDDSKSFFLKLADMAKVYEKFQTYQRNKSLIDFDEMIFQAVKLLERRTEVAKKYRNKFKHIFVDEFQDNNYAQLELVKLLSKNGNVTVVGDDDQCIYKFQGAYLTIFKDFQDYFSDTKLITLNQNYRSTQNIVKVASQLFNGVSERQDKKLFSENEHGDRILVACCQNENSEVDFVVNKIRELIGKPVERRDKSIRPLTYSDFAILSRKKSLGQKFVNGLKSNNIPIVTSRESNLFANPIVKDFIGFLKIAVDPGRSGIEITRLMIHAGVLESNIAEINRVAKNRAYADPTDIDFVYETLKDYSSLNITQVYTIRELYDQIQKLVTICNTFSLSELIHEIILSISGLYKQSLISNKPVDRRNRLILKELNRISLEYESLNPHSNVSDFISHLLLIGKIDLEIEEVEEFEDAVWITTIHQCKGKEFPVVFVVDVATDRLPLKYQSKKIYVPTDLSKGVKISEDEKEIYTQEERRLFYVALTRAQNLLFVTFAKIYGDNMKETKPSRFLKEINYENNPLIKYEEFAAEGPALSSTFILDKIEKTRTDLQIMATKAITQMKLKTAIEKIISLSKLKYYEENNTFEGFNPESILSIQYTDNLLNGLLKAPLSLINKANLKLSVSKLETYKDCPLKFKFAHVLEIPSTQKSFFDLGTSIHSTIEHLTKLEKDGVEITENLSLQILEKEWITYSFKSETESEQAKERAKTMIHAYLNWKVKNRNSPLDAEKKFSIQIADIPFNGSIDRVELTPEGELEVIDFKTGGVYETKKSIQDNFQMNVYAIATEKLYGKLPKKTSLFYLKKDKILTNSIDPSHLEAVTETFKDMVNSILKEDFDPTPSFETCRICDYQIICDNKKIKL